jgi:prephenate dehydratase
MSLSIAYLGPPGTYSEIAAQAYARWLAQVTQEAAPGLCPYPSIVQTLRSVAAAEAHTAVVPVENSIEGGVAATLDTLWQLESLQIQQALVLPIAHALISKAPTLQSIEAIYSHPQALGQCQQWLEKFLPTVQLVPTNSTTEALQSLKADPSLGAIASQRAAQLYQLPVLACPINDYADNCTRFWVLSQRGIPGAMTEAASPETTSLAFSLPQNRPGSLVKPLQIFADRQLNLSRIESRPSKRSLGDYIFFVDLEASLAAPSVQSALGELGHHTEVLKILGSYPILNI